MRAMAAVMMLRGARGAEEDIKIYAGAYTSYRHMVLCWRSVRCY